MRTRPKPTITPPPHSPDLLPFLSERRLSWCTNRPSTTLVKITWCRLRYAEQRVCERPAFLFTAPVVIRHLFNTRSQNESRTFSQSRRYWDPSPERDRIYFLFTRLLFSRPFPGENIVLDARQRHPVVFRYPVFISYGYSMMIMIFKNTSTRHESFLAMIPRGFLSY